MSLELFIINFSYVAIFLLLVLNGVISFPSSQILYIISGYFAYTGDLNLMLIVLVGGVGNFIGNFILYELSRRKGLEYVLKLNKFIGFDIFREKEIEKIRKVFERKRGYLFLFFGKFINPIKVIIPVPAGISRMNRFLFGVIIMVSSILWALIFTSLGFFFGKNFELFGYYGALMLILAGTFIYIFYKSMNKDEVIEELGK